MALSSTIHQFAIDLSDIDRGVYEHFDLRVAQHPSESTSFLITRMIAWCVLWEEGLAFGSGGLSRSEEPALEVVDGAGRIRLWIEVGVPSARRVHKAAKAADRVAVFAHRDPGPLQREAQKERIFRGEAILVYAFDPSVLSEISARLSRKNTWQAMLQDGLLTIVIGDDVFALPATGVPLIG